MIDVYEAMDKLKSKTNDPVVHAYDYDSDYYLFEAVKDTSKINYGGSFYAVNKNDGSVYHYSCNADLDAFFDVIENRPIDISQPKPIKHHGIIGQKWGLRRFQNPDGTLTEEGKRRYKIDEHGHYVDLTKKKFDRTKNPLADARQMSDEDLKRARDRATMENTYADQMKKQHVETLPEKIKKKISEAMTNTINNAINTGITRLGNKITEMALSSVGLSDPNAAKKDNNQNQQQGKKKQKQDQQQPEVKKKDDQQQPEAKKKEESRQEEQSANQTNHEPSLPGWADNNVVTKETKPKETQSVNSTSDHRVGTRDDNDSFRVAQEPARPNYTTSNNRSSLFGPRAEVSESRSHLFTPESSAEYDRRNSRSSLFGDRRTYAPRNEDPTNPATWGGWEGKPALREHGIDKWKKPAFTSSSQSYEKRLKQDKDYDTSKDEVKKKKKK